MAVMRMDTGCGESGSGVGIVMLLVVIVVAVAGISELWYSSLLMAWLPPKIMQQIMV